MCSDDGGERRDGGRVHHSSSLHHQDEVRGEISGEPQQTAGGQPDGEHLQDGGQREGADLLSARHLTGNLKGTVHLFICLISCSTSNTERKTKMFCFIIRL